MYLNKINFHYINKNYHQIFYEFKNKISDLNSNNPRKFQIKDYLCKTILIKLNLKN